MENEKYGCDPFSVYRRKIETVCNFEEGGKITPQQAYKRIKKINKEFKNFYKSNRESEGV
jgi:hypothetical protein